MNFDDLLEEELEEESKLQNDKSLGVASEVSGERELKSNELIRQRLMESIKSKTLQQADRLEDENAVHNTPFSLSPQSPVEEVSVDELSEQLESSLSEIMSNTNKRLAKSMDLTQDLPNVERVSLDQYILVEGPYSSLFSEFIMSDKAVPKGTMPLCIKMQDKVIMMKEIQPTPDILFKLKYFLEGFQFSVVRNGETTELNIYEFLGKIKILED